MYSDGDHNKPEQNASTAFPVGLLLLSISAILVYLAIGGAFSEKRTDIVVYTPQATDALTPR
ncbi:hypothetical protein [Sinorhizobium alkalisoli]|uniref:Uncharacterized protein n=1 Tax=Sinorhizobium alkalisoli TaxID=1752398 RepID=A0A1E3VAK3_9HYPH|nr:hypothetical protein [Sinorhizobium alkalisoli]MCA1492484.1 hypothetical protein [Ensifer sp. NBAIM29]ODR90638.1 hypothetical protein A8M32_15085 [Sinorhizobium alkalisoli]QFI67536.1 hypothetical protein EKH55_2662 [Sinorhizobium alkalisoli]